MTCTDLRRSRTFDLSKIRDLIETCGKSGVSLLRLGDLEVHFGRVSSPSQGERLSLEEASPAPAAMGPTVGLGDGEPDASSTLDPEVLEELEEQQRMLDDPTAFETQKIDELIGP